MGSFLIVFFLLLVGVIVLLIRLCGKVYYKKTQWILGGYIAILLVSFIFVHMLPKDGFLEEELVKQNDPWITGQEYQEFHNAAEEGRLDQVENAYKNREWSFEYTGEQLEIVPADKGFNIRVIVKNKDIDDGIIDAASFTGRSIINGIDYTDKIKPPEVTLEGSQLKITKSESLRIELARFDRDFTVKQFLPGGRINNNHRSSMSISHGGTPVLYIQVPRSVQVDGDY